MGLCSVRLKRLLSNDKLSKILLNEYSRNQEMWKSRQASKLKTFLYHIFMHTFQSTYSLNENNEDQSLPLSCDSIFFPILFLFFLPFPSVFWALPVFPIPGVECDLLIAFERNSSLATFSKCLQDNNLEIRMLDKTKGLLSLSMDIYRLSFRCKFSTKLLFLQQNRRISRTVLHSNIASKLE